MTRKDYTKFAQAIFEIRAQNMDVSDKDAPIDESNGSILDLTERIASIFAADNPSFDRSKFLIACGYPV